MAEALPEAERSLWEAQAGDDDEVTMMVRKMKYEEVKGKRGGTFYHTPTDGHIYRFNRNGKDNKTTKDASIKEQCFGRAVLDPETKEIKITTPHNHTPDMILLQKLNVE